MSVSRTLLERLESPDRGGQRDLGGNLEEIRTSIGANLQRIFNAYYGNSPATPHFGISSLSDHAGGLQASKAIANEIRVAIIRFEPRLIDVRVEFVEDRPDQFELRFDIVANIAGEDDMEAAVFRSVIEPTGHIRIGGR